MTPDELGMPPGTRWVRADRDRGGGWEQEYIAVPVDELPAGAPVLRWRSSGHVVSTFAVWYLAVTHAPSGFRLARRWHPDMGPEREWIATSRDGTFGLLGQARGLFRHAGRPLAFRGAEDIIAERDHLQQRIGRAPTAAELARSLRVSTDTLRAYADGWGIDLSTEKV